jgi:hypothetical protein
MVLGYIGCTGCICLLVKEFSNFLLPSDGAVQVCDATGVSYLFNSWQQNVSKSFYDVVLSARKKCFKTLLM